MDKILKLAILCLSLFAITCFADTLALSARLKIEHPAPNLSIHTRSGLIVKYTDEKLFMHVIVEPKNVYPKIDLTGKAELYIRSIFDEEKRGKLSKELADLSKEQADQFGVTPNNVYRSKVGNSDAIAVYNSSDKKGQIFVFEEFTIHQIYTHGSKEDHDQFLHSIKER